MMKKPACFLLWAFSQAGVFCLFPKFEKLSGGGELLESRRSADPPTFSQCPSHRISTTNRRVTWTVTASVGAVLKQVQGGSPGSLFEYGVHLIKYSAKNSAGLEATCSFIVDVKPMDCPEPTSDDPDIRFRCNGNRYRSYCHLRCTSGATITGSKYITCGQDGSEENRSFWKPLHGRQATCFKSSCPPLHVPKNGALICDKELGRSLCEMQCNDMYDVQPRKGGMPNFICGTNSSQWKPSNEVPDCQSEALPDEYFLPSEHYYFHGDCSARTTQTQAKKNFISNLNRIRVSPCVTQVCSVYQVTTACDKRQTTKRAAGHTLHIRATYALKNVKRNMYPAEARSDLETLVEKYSKIFSESLAEGSDGKYTIGDMLVKCPSGHGLSTTKEHVCVPCSKGSYADPETMKCTSCPPNTYQDKPGSTSCIAFPSRHGTTNQDKGSPEAPGARARAVHV